MQMHKIFFLLSAAVLLASAPVSLKAQNFDTSGTAGLNGQYLFRYVTMFNDQNGNVVESCSLTGVMTFNGQGTYALSGTTLYDSAGSTTGDCSSLGGGTYGVQSNGMAQFDNPMFPATLYGAFSQPVITASSTEDDYYDLFVAVQSPQNGLTNSNLNGAYTVGSIEFPSVATAEDTLVHQAYFTVTANGSGGLTNLTLVGSAENLTATVVNQTVAGATYALSGTNGGTLTIPNTQNSQLISGTKMLYVSADGNYLLGGSATGADMVFGFRSAASPSNSLLSGTYFAAGLEANLSDGNFLDSYWGSVNANGSGTLLWHQRYDDVVDAVTYDSTFNTPVTINSNGTYYDGVYTTLVGFNGQAAMQIGSGQEFSLDILVHAPAYTQTGSVWINPIGITNAANYSPITNAYAPGELVNIYGSFGVATQVDGALPVPTNLSGVQVTVNGYSAPVYLVSANQISALIPYEIATDLNGSIDSFATFQVIVNGTKSNSVTVYVDQTSPGLYSNTENGIGPSAILHANGTAEVTPTSAATPGETVSLFMNGLGTVTPTVADGAGGPTNPLSYADEYNNSELAVYLDDFVDNPPQVNITYAGLAPGFPGLYQVNFTIPTRGLGNGLVYINFQTYEGETEMSTISLQGFGHASGVTSESVRKTKISRTRAIAAAQIRRGHPAVAKHTRARALAARVVE